MEVAALTPEWLLLTVVTVWGLLWGSFLNVLIVRVPNKEDVIFKKSHCPQCKKAIRWFDNIPLLSFALLRGKCRNCGKKISWQYPFVEAVAGALTLILYSHFGLTVAGVEAWILSMMLIALIKIDLDVRLLPDIFTFPGMALGFLFAVTGQGLVTWVSSLIGLVVGFGFFYAIAWAYWMWKKKEGLGGGDIKLLGMLGAFLGIGALPVVILVSSLTGTLVGLLQMIVKREGLQTAIPFGPFLAIGGWVALLWGERIMTWYLGGGTP